tara:strand:- start:45 stop:1319 length:1275 start_codon:yes stop_codon:yes gene_type:complete
MFKNSCLTRAFNWFTKKLPHQDKKDHEAIDRFFAEIDFQTRAETVKPENVEKTKQAFYELMDEMGWDALKVTFDELLEELESVTRKKTDTPAWYHQFRQCLYDISTYRSGLYSSKNLEKHGGLEVSLIAKLRHDSYEDYGKTPHAIYAPMEKRLHEKNEKGDLNDHQLLNARKQIAAAVDIVDLMSRKWKYFDGEKEVTREKHDGDPNQFLRGQYAYFFAVMGKMGDGVENISTRMISGDYLASQNIGPYSQKPEDNPTYKPVFTVDQNMGYVRKARGLYGRFAAYKEAANKWPELSRPIHSLDAALGVCIVINEVVNDHYAPNSKHNSANAFPLRMDQYKDAALMFEHIPDGWNPFNIMTEELEEIATIEKEYGVYKMAALLERSIYPPMIELGLLPETKTGSMVEFSNGISPDVILPTELET